MPKVRFRLKAPLPTEAAHQSYLFDWIDRVGQHRWPELKWTYAVPNGASYYGQHRFAEAAKQRAMGLRRGVPDVVVPCPLFVYEPGDRPDEAKVWHGIYIEMKRSRSEKLSAEQEAYRDYLISAGYGWARCDSGAQAVEVITAYMEGRFDGHMPTMDVP